MAAITTERPGIGRGSVICAKCGAELNWDRDVCSHILSIRPCNNCLNEAEARVVRASAEDIHQAREQAARDRDELRLHQSEQWKDGYRVGYKEGFKDGQE